MAVGQLGSGAVGRLGGRAQWRRFRPRCQSPPCATVSAEVALNTATMALVGPNEIKKLVDDTEGAVQTLKNNLYNVTYITNHQTPYLRMTTGFEGDQATIQILKECIAWLEPALEHLKSFQGASAPGLTTGDYYRIKGDINTAYDRGERTYTYFSDKKRYSYHGNVHQFPPQVGVPGGNPPQVGVPGLVGTGNTTDAPYKLATVMGSRNAPNMTYGDYWFAGQNRAMRWTT